MSLLELYKEYHPDIIGRLSKFSEINKRRLIKKLEIEKDKRNFLSTISEIKFGELFNALHIESIYDKKINSKTPDWTLNCSTSEIICDVYRLGQSKSDQIRSDFENSLIEHIKKIQAHYIIRISFIQEYFEPETYNIKSIVTKLSEWIFKSKPKIGDKILISENFYFTVLSNNSNHQFVSCWGNINSIEYKIGKIEQEQNSYPNEITKKLTKYNEIIESFNMPYFLCIDIDFGTGVNHDEFEEYFKGKSAILIDYEEVKYIPEFKQLNLGKEWTILGEFYNNPQLSGIITCLNQSFKILFNPLKKQIIYDEKYREIVTKLKNINNSK
ncbi:hypothetical protein [Flavobacterium lipolyticum]|uniref:Uncharacterized protein n=1 Tax=Flavobacterium lipolyticum TaxID=2893754 RepID=A0ABS8M4P8_9FLAO|nr:hypothetical protein [Flavobacterium sp. F-126]MCC9019790.1 hypothetical protein [Flavobacterium sp. F-126]